MKILICDTLYPDFIRANPINPAASYASNLKALLQQSFGTADFYSRNLRALGHECVDVIANHENLQQLWAAENMSGQGRRGERILDAQIEAFKPDCIFLQDLSVQLPKTDALIAGQCSCPLPSEANLRKCDVLFSSFQHYVDRFEGMGIRAVYNPLAFDPIALKRVLDRHDSRNLWAFDDFPDRVHDCVFIGGVGNPSHWKRGMEVLEQVASQIPAFKWWGYGVDTLPADSALRDKYQGQAFGLDMYRIFLQSKIVLNRHGEVARGYSNNLRLFEASGCGAALLTEDSPNLKDFFKPFIECIPYESAADCVEKIKVHLFRWQDCTQFIAKNGQARTLREHTYQTRMKTVSDTLQEMLAVVAQ